MFELLPNRRRRDFPDIFRELDNHFFKEFTDFGLTDFKTDIEDKDGAYVLKADLPGFAKEDIKVDIHGDCLAICAERKQEKDEKDSEGNYIRRERSYGKFQRRFNIDNVKADEIEASYKDGVLEITMPKKEIAPTSEPKHLDIK